MSVNWRKKRYYNLLLWTGFVTTLVLVIWWGSDIVMETDWLAADDYPGYWAAGKLDFQGSNPYSPDWMQSLQIKGDIPTDLLEVLRNSEWLLPTWTPPWTLPLLIPFSILNYQISRIAWFLLNIVLIFLSADTLWRLYGGSEKYRWVSWVLCFTFIPILDAIKKGQIGIIILLGIVGFLFFIEKKKFWLAGISLALLAIKPHIAYLFLLVVIIWSLQQHAWPVIVGFTTALLGATLISSLFNKSITAHYIFALQNYPPSDWITPTIGGGLRLLFGSEYFWLQFLPTILGTIWLVIYWAKRKINWDWMEQAPLIILVSLLTTAYGWSFDQPSSLVAIIQIFTLISLFPWQKASWIISITYILINVLNILSPGNEFFLVWLAPVLLLWYLASRWLIDNRMRIFKTNHQS